MSAFTFSIFSQPNQTAITPEALWQELQRFLSSVFALDPDQAVLRAGLTLLVLIGVALALTVLRLILRAIIARVSPKDEDANKQERSERRNVGGMTLGVIRFALMLAAIGVILHIWGLDLSMFATGATGALLGQLGRAVLIIVLALAAIEVANFAISRIFSRIADRAREPRRAGQIRTLGPVLKAIVDTAIFIIAAMMLLSQIGVEVGPLIAGAGIVGLAVGFGAQTLVKDFLTGFFLILEDIVSVGDIARIGDEGGVVEEMTLRTIRLRGFDGTLHVFPYSEAQVIHNMTKNFSFYVFDLSIAYSSDIMKALDIMKQVGADLQRDPEFGAVILEPIEIFGVDALADSGVALKARFRTLPAKQWSVGREYLKRIKLAFDANGIEIPFPHVKLVAPDQPVPIDEPNLRAAE